MMASANDRQSRRELLDTISEQKDQIGRYESRLRDVVRAYKGLVKEKEALESSIKILGTNAAPTSTAGAESEASETSDKETSNDDESSTTSKEIDRISTLTQSLATLTSEKSRLEQSFQEDKKKVRAEIKEKNKTIESILVELKEVKEKSRVETEEAKSKLIIERHNREKESSDHALMLRELQKLVTDERSAKEKLENELQSAKDSLKALQLAGTYNAEYEKRVRDLESELKSKNQMVEELKIKANQTSPELLKLKDDLNEMKLSHRRELERAEQKTLTTEERSTSLSGQQETRVANLESRLQELSETVGTYDRLRQNDQMSMQKLRDRIAQLDLENQSLQNVRRNDSLPELDGDNDSNLDVQSLIERILRLRAMLRDANRRSENPVDLDELLDINEGEKKWKKSYYQMKEDFEKYKLTRRTPSPFMSSSSSSPSKKTIHDDDEVDELIKLKSHVQELNEKVKYTSQQLSLAGIKEAEFTQIETKLKVEIADLKERSKKDLEAKESEFKIKIVQLEMEIQKQRDRCLNLIEEKDEELSALKNKLDNHSNDYMEDLTKVEETKLDTLVLHYSEEMSKNQLELRELRCKKMELESALHELQMSALSKAQKYQEDIEDMEDAMVRLKRMATKEGSNLEYLKNVTLTYMLSTDFKSKEHMLKAIGAVLMFTTVEIKQVRDYNASWWPAATTSKKL